VRHPSRLIGKAEGPDRSQVTRAFGTGRFGDPGRTGDARQRRASSGFGGASVALIGPRFGQSACGRLRHPLAALTTLAVAGLAVAGCGSSSSSSSGKTEASGYPSHSASTSNNAAASGGSTSTAAASSAGAGTAIATEHTKLGTVLTAGPKHLTVYLFEADKGSTSTCSEACAQVWPPVTTKSAPKAEGEAVAADLGTTARSDGTKQVTYKGHPLYWYASDSQTGETTGQGINSFGAAWYVMSPKGSKIDHS
jgi:predicted lipoprotein with Yx(FWY)xxD motif